MRRTLSLSSRFFAEAALFNEPALAISPSFEAGLAPLDERSNSFFGVRAVHHAFPDIGDSCDRRSLGRLDIFQRGRFHGSYAERSVPANQIRDLGRAFDLLARRDYFLDEPDLQRAFGAELVAQHQMIHRVAPAGAREKTKMRAAQWRDSAPRLHLAEAGVIGGDDYIAGQHHLNANRVG